eukprot:SAG31_NODE_2423_length_5725_cov_29.530750_3_plen_159_part_00
MHNCASCTQLGRFAFYNSAHCGGGSPGIGKLPANAWTLPRSAATSSLSTRAALKSFSNLPEVLWIFSANWMLSSSKVATCRKSSSLKPREVSAGVPSRIPPGDMALRSPNTAFLLAVMWQASKMLSALEPVMPAWRQGKRGGGAAAERKYIHQWSGVH